MMPFNFDKNFFKQLTKESAWILGWILADGCIYDNKRLSIRLASVDREVLVKMTKLLKYDGNIYDTVRDGKFFNSGFFIYNEELMKDLAKFNALPRKSLTLEYPNNIPTELTNHFIRGFWEGDGCVKYNKQRNYISINFKGTPEFLGSLKQKLKEELNIKGTIYGCTNTTKNVVNYEISGNDATIRFLNWIYKNSSDECRLLRKYNRSKELYNIVLSKRQKPINIPLEI